MKNKLYMFLAGVAGVLVLFFSILQAGANKAKVKILKKEKKANDEDQKIADNVNSLDSDDVSSRLQ